MDTMELIFDSTKKNLWVEKLPILQIDECIAATFGARSSKCGTGAVSLIGSSQLTHIANLATKYASHSVKICQQLASHYFRCIGTMSLIYILIHLKNNRAK